MKPDASQVYELPSEEIEEDITPPTRQEILPALDTLERFAASSKASDGVTEVLNTVGCKVTRHFRSHERQ